MNYDDNYGKHHSRWDEYEPEEEIYVYDQCCKNCIYFRQSAYGSECVHPEHDEFDCPADDGSDWCDLWKGKRGRQ